MKPFPFLFSLLILAVSALAGGCIVPNPTQDSSASTIPTTKTPVILVETNINLQDTWKFPIKGGRPYHIELQSSSPVFISMWGPGPGEETIFARYSSYDTDVLMGVSAKEIHVWPVEDNGPVNVHIKIVEI
jgi:hypothetical protein